MHNDKLKSLELGANLIYINKFGKIFRSRFQNFKHSDNHLSIINYIAGNIILKNTFFSFSQVVLHFQHDVYVETYQPVEQLLLYSLHPTNSNRGLE